MSDTHDYANKFASDFQLIRNEILKDLYFSEGPIVSSRLDRVILPLLSLSIATFDAYSEHRLDFYLGINDILAIIKEGVKQENAYQAIEVVMAKKLSDRQMENLFLFVSEGLRNYPPINLRS